MCKYDVWYTLKAKSPDDAVRTFAVCYRLTSGFIASLDFVLNQRHGLNTT